MENVFLYNEFMSTKFNSIDIALKWWQLFPWPYLIILIKTFWWPRLGLKKKICFFRGFVGSKYFIGIKG
jgi:hypothetical protein